MSQAEDFIKRQQNKLKDGIPNADISISVNAPHEPPISPVPERQTVSSSPSPDCDVRKSDTPTAPVSRAAVSSSSETRDVIAGVVGIALLIAMIVCMVNGVSKILGVSIGILGFAIWKGVRGH